MCLYGLTAASQIIPWTTIELSAGESLGIPSDEPNMVKFSDGSDVVYKRVIVRLLAWLEAPRNFHIQQPVPVEFPQYQQALGRASSGSPVVMQEPGEFWEPRPKIRTTVKGSEEASEISINLEGGTSGGNVPSVSKAHFKWLR